jgi:putative hemolysin
VMPRVPFPLDDVPPRTDVEPPALIRGYLRLGTKLLGPPAWDHRFNTADLPMLVSMADLHPRYRRSCAGG